jgi:hypothetical protein
MLFNGRKDPTLASIRSALSRVEGVAQAVAQNIE